MAPKKKAPEKKSAKKSAGKRKKSNSPPPPPPAPPPPPTHPDKDRCLALAESVQGLTIREVVSGFWSVMCVRMNSSRDKNRRGGKYDNTLQLRELHVCVKCLEYLAAEGDESCVRLNLLHCCYAGTGFKQHIQSSHNSHGVNGAFDDLQEVYVFSSFSSSSSSSSSSSLQSLFIRFRRKRFLACRSPRE